jgi:hypothetical protein
VSGFTVLANTTTCTSILHVNGSLVVNSDPPNILLKTTNTYNIGVATTNAMFSNSAIINDMIIRSAGNLLLQSGVGACALKIDTNNNISCTGTLTANDTLTIIPSATTRNGINLYCYPTGIYNSNGNSNSVDINVCCNTNPFTTSTIINAVAADGWNGINTIITLACTGWANSGYANGSRIVLDGSYATNSSKGSYGSTINFQSQIKF